MSDKPIRIAIIGLGFGAEFIPIYQAYPGVELTALCQRTKSELDRIGDAFQISKRYTSYEELLKDPDIDAVHIVAHGSEGEVRDKVVEAHRVLMSLNEENRARFQDLMAALERG